MAGRLVYDGRDDVQRHARAQQDLYQALRPFVSLKLKVETTGFTGYEVRGHDLKDWVAQYTPEAQATIGQIDKQMEAVRRHVLFAYGLYDDPESRSLGSVEESDG
jgi:hypothetical protein